LYVDYRCLEGETRPVLSAIDQLGAKARSIGARPLAALVATIRRARTLHDVVPPIEDRGASGGLTGREVEVLRFLADGLSDRQIAERLGISKRTVSTHVSHILAKLSVGKRAEAALLARHLPENGDPRHARMS
jgi:DNA-binding NarL/FixJ family response regulator